MASGIVQDARILKLPVDLLLRILGYLRPVPHYFVLSAVCKLFYYIAHDPGLYRELSVDHALFVEWARDAKRADAAGM